MNFVSLRKLLVTTAVSGLAFGVMAANATAGIEPIGAAPLTILKTVSGTVPAGTTFTATTQCDDNIINDGGEGVDSAMVQFDATGQPTTPDTVTFGSPGTCTVTETVNGGATSTTYACEGTEPVEPPTSTIPAPEGSGFGSAAAPVEEICSAAGPQAAPITVNILFEDQTATVTIHNTFPDPQPQPAAQVVAQPAFTG